MQRIFTSKSFWISVFLSLLVLLLYVLSQPEIHVIPSLEVPELIELKALDFRFRLRGPIHPQDEIVIIGVDEKTEDELGRWQSSGRRWIARLLEVLHDGGAKIVGFDFVLAEPDEGAALEVIEAVKSRYLELRPSDAETADILAYLKQLKTTHNYDVRLRNAIEKTANIILGHYHFLSPAGAQHLTPEKHDSHHELLKRTKYSMVKYPPGISRQPLRLLHSFGVEPNLAMFAHAAKSFGHFNVIPSADGYIRYAPLLIEYMGEYYPSFDMEILRTYLNPSLPPLIYALGKEGGGNIEAIQLGNIRIPCDETGTLFINYYGPGYTFPHYSIADVVKGRTPPETFHHKIVLVGFTSEIYQDLHSTTFQQGTYPGVEVHATVIENILRNDFLLKPEWTTPVNALEIFLLGILLGIILYRVRSHIGALAAVLVVAAIGSIAHYAFVVYRIWLNFTFPLLFVVLDYLVITTYKYFSEERKKRVLKQAFQHYVAPTVVEHMLKQVNQLRLGGERKQMSVLFSDIRGFTSISEAMEPEELVQFLNHYLTAMTRIVLDYEGTVDKYMGDAIMAFYSAPLDQPDHAIRACHTAIEMLNQLKAFHTRQNSQIIRMLARWEAQGLWPLNIGIGINSGDMIVGNMGSDERFDYTIMGDNVNLASRLEGINKQYGTNIVISEFTYRQITHEPFFVRELDVVRVKGKLHPVTIYELLAYGTLSEQQKAVSHHFSEGLHAYKQKQWQQAMLFFQKALQTYPDDKPSQLYIDRCSEYLQHPPSDDWDGVFVMKTK